ncbi:MAG: hypothetical protein PHD99_02345 [Candidatus Moranbacteria bacterium]|nr:hypothetical protein [Candidatus Moranbacteria bacterium]
MSSITLKGTVTSVQFEFARWMEKETEGYEKEITNSRLTILSGDTITLEIFFETMEKEKKIVWEAE